MRRMFVVCVCLFSTAAMCAQSVKDAFNTFRDSVVKQQFVLRDFSGETKVHAAWTGTQFVLDTPKWQTFAVLQIRSVKMKGEQISMECDRHVLAWNEANSLAQYPVTDSVVISIDLRGGDAAQLLPQLREAIFYSSTADALGAVPKPLRKSVPARENKGAQNAGAMTKPCDCSEDDPCASVKGAQGYVFPKIVHAGDPRFSEEARRLKINGNVVTAFIVDERGLPHDVWITRPLGYGLDGEAAKAVFTYVFQPATCHGTPVSVPLGAAINFQIF